MAQSDLIDTAEARSNVLSLVSTHASKISNVSLYSGRAEVTRCFKLALTEGQNQVTIQGLPFQLQQDSVRVEGRGSASIHDVVISRTPRDDSAKPPRIANPLERKRQELKNQIASVKQTRASLDTYLGTLKANEVDITKLEEIFNSHALLACKLDNSILDLEKEVAEVTQQAMLLRKESDSSTDELVRLPWQVAINVWAATDEEVEIWLKYVVSNADWSASYDIRVDTQSPGNNITILYKASITQNTGESWDGVPLTLETVTPMLGMVAPSLPSWNVAAFEPRFAVPAMVHASQPIIIAQMPSMSVSRSRSRSSRSRSPRRHRDRHSSPRRSRSHTRAPVMQHQRVAVTNKGSVTATFRIPGFINVPSDAQQHNVTISRFEFKAPIVWHTIPKVDARVYMEAKIKNETEYTFIKGPANIYVDGSFVATTSIPLVSPQESFNCALGLDSSLRVTYHQRETNTGITGFYKKSTTKTFIQRITILNTKSIPLENLKVVDVIPVAQDERIEIKLLNPALPLPSSAEASRKSMSLTPTEKGSNSKEQSVPRIQVSPGVVAQWDGSSNPEINQDALGNDGRVSWVVSLHTQGTVNLILKCEVSYPESLVVEGI